MPSLVIDGRYKPRHGLSPRIDARRLVYINGRKRWLQQKPFSYLVELAKWRGVGDGWISNNRLPGHISEQRGQTIYLLRRQSGLEIENNRCECYRLAMKPGEIEILKGV